MRAFFGLGLDPENLAAIDSWRSKSLPGFRRPVDPYNFHLTLGFLGEVNAVQTQALIEQAIQIQTRPFHLRLDTVGYWPRQEIYCLAPSAVPQELERLAKDIKQLARRVGLRSEKRQYQPHLTLARRCEVAPPEPLLLPDFHLQIEEFFLYESHLHSSGVRYEILEAFQLRG